MSYTKNIYVIYILEIKNCYKTVYLPKQESQFLNISQDYTSHAEGQSKHISRIVYTDKHFFKNAYDFQFPVFKDK